MVKIPCLHCNGLGVLGCLLRHLLVVVEVEDLRHGLLFSFDICVTVVSLWASKTKGQLKF